MFDVLNYKEIRQDARGPWFSGTEFLLFPHNLPTQQSTYDIQVKIISAQFFRLIFLLQILKNKQNKKALFLFFMDLLFHFQIILESLT